MILEAFGGISPHSLHFIRRLARRTEGRARATAHRLQSFEHERQVVLRTPHAAARSGRAGGRREGVVRLTQARAAGQRVLTQDNACEL